MLAIRVRSSANARQGTLGLYFLYPSFSAAPYGRVAVKSQMIFSSTLRLSPCPIPDSIGKLSESSSLNLALEMMFLRGPGLVWLSYRPGIVPAGWRRVSV